VEELTPVILLAALATQVTTIVKFLTAGYFRQAVTALVPWAVAFVALLLAANAGEINDYTLPGLSDPLGAMDMASLLFAAAAIGSSGGLLYKAITAIDNTDSSAEPPLGGGPPTAG
jgi:hypothetical protein